MDEILSDFAITEHRKRGKPRKEDGTERTEDVETPATETPSSNPVSKTVSNVKKIIDFDAPDRLKLDPTFEANPNCEYRWAKKGPELPFKIAEKGWEKVEGHSDRHDLVLVRRSKELSAQETAALEDKNRKREGSYGKDLEDAAQTVIEAARNMGIDIPNIIMRGVNNRRIAGAPKSSGKFFSIPS